MSLRIFLHHPDFFCPYPTAKRPPPLLVHLNALRLCRLAVWADNPGVVEQTLAESSEGTGKENTRTGIFFSGGIEEPLPRPYPEFGRFKGMCALKLTVRCGAAKSIRAES